MISRPTLKRVLLGALVTCALAFAVSTQVRAVFVEERLDDPVLEARAHEISEGIRCLVCQNQSIMDSNADLAKDLRGIVRERIAAGDSNDAVQQYLVDRYGDWVLLNPPLKMRTLLLWGFPFAALFFGAIFVVRFLRSKSKPPVGTEGIQPLSVQEAADLKKLMTDTEDGTVK